MEEEKVTKVVTTLTAGAAKPIPVNSVDAQVIAAEQAKAQQEIQTQQVVQTVQTQPVQTGLEQAANTPIQQMNQVDQNVMAAQANEQNQQIDVSQLNEVNDLVMVKEVKSNPKTVIILCCVIAVIVGVIIYELFALGIL